MGLVSLVVQVGNSLCAPGLRALVLTCTWVQVAQSEVLGLGWVGVSLGGEGHSLRSWLSCDSASRRGLTLTLGGRERSDGPLVRLRAHCGVLLDTLEGLRYAGQSVAYVQAVHGDYSRTRAGMCR